MIGKTFVRLCGAFVCLTVVAAGWDAEAAHCRQRRCCAPVCCSTPCYVDPCCAPVCETVYRPTCCTTVARCCAPVTYTVVQESIVVPATCCAATTTVRETAIAAQAAAPSVKLAATTR